MSRDYLLHGRRHGPQGSDPIPGLVGGAEYATLGWFGSLAVAGSGGEDIPWSEFETTNTAVFGTVVGSGSTPHNTTADTGLLLMGQGVYILMAAAQWESGAANVTSFLTTARGQNLLEIDYKAIEFLAATTLAAMTQSLNPSSFHVANVTSGGTSLVNFNNRNFDTGTWHVTSALLAAIYWPTSVDPASIY